MKHGHFIFCDNKLKCIYIILKEYTRHAVTPWNKYLKYTIEIWMDYRIRTIKNREVYGYISVQRYLWYQWLAIFVIIFENFAAVQKKKQINYDDDLVDSSLSLLFDNHKTIVVPKVSLLKYSNRYLIKKCIDNFYTKIS